jgi:tyrosyl-tRNA synthetase
MTKQQKIQELLGRGVKKIYPSKAFLEKRLSEKKPLTLYVGYDPTAPTLHIGNGITLLKLRDFQLLGHKVIMLVGDFTAMIGDPTDKTAERQSLSFEKVRDNCKRYKEQAEEVLDFEGKNPAEVRFNNDWLGSMTFAEVLELASMVTVPQLLERDMFQKRLSEGKTVRLHELMYPLMQGYDSVAMDVDGEVGGNDQTFNMLVGRDLLKSMKQKEKFVLTTKLLVDNSGKKMGKTEGNMISLADSPEDMFGKVMRWSDDMIASGFELCTRVPMKEVDEVTSSLKKGENPRDAKLMLAFEITKQFLGEEAAKVGQDHFSTVIQQKKSPEDIKTITPSTYDIVSVLKEAGFVKSNSDARRAIDGGGVKVNDGKVTTYDCEVQKGDVIQKGKRFFVRIA